MPAPAPTPPVFENFTFNGLYLTGRCLESGKHKAVPPVEIEGFLPEGYEVRNVELRNCTLPKGAALRLSRCRGIALL